MKNICLIVTYNRLSLLKECIKAVKNQKTPFDKILVIDNNSTDGTKSYLMTEKDIDVIRKEENLGGAGGFSEGIGYILENYPNYDNVLLIDDDAILRPEFLENLLSYQKKKMSVPLAGSVVTDGVIDKTQRRNIKSRLLFIEKPCDTALYKKPFFKCDAATFCGLFLPISLVRKAGRPVREYFIWYDDTEYSLRFKEIHVVPGAVLDHKTKRPEKKEGILSPLLNTSWKSYYGLRNRYDTARRHFGALSGAVIDLEYYALFMISLVYKFHPDKEIREASRFNVKMIKDAAFDARHSNFGRNPSYMP